MTIINANGVAYDTDDLFGYGLYETVVAGTGESLPLWTAIHRDLLADAANGSVTTSTTSLAIGSGSKTFVLAASIPLFVGCRVVAVDAANANNKMWGEVTSWTPGTKTAIISVDLTEGSGTIANWIFAGKIGKTGATGSLATASISEVNTGTDTAKAVTPDSLAGSKFGVMAATFPSLATHEMVAGDGWSKIVLPSYYNGMNLVDVMATVNTAGTTGTALIQVHNVTQAADMLTTRINIDSGGTSSKAASTQAVIDTSNDDVATGDVIRIDVDAVHTTPALGLVVYLFFQLP